MPFRTFRSDPSRFIHRRGKVRFPCIRNRVIGTSKKTNRSAYRGKSALQTRFTGEVSAKKSILRRVQQPSPADMERRNARSCRRLHFGILPVHGPSLRMIRERLPGDMGICSMYDASHRQHIREFRSTRREEHKVKDGALKINTIRRSVSSDATRATANGYSYASANPGSCFCRSGSEPPHLQQPRKVRVLPSTGDDRTQIRSRQSLLSDESPPKEKTASQNGLRRGARMVPVKYGREVRKAPVARRLPAETGPRKAAAFIPIYRDS